LPTQGGIAHLYRRQATNTTTTAAQTISTPAATDSLSVTIPVTTANSTTPVGTTTSTTLRPTTTTANLTTSLTATTTANSTSTPTESPSGDSNSGLIIGGAAVGGLVFAIGIAIVLFKCTLSRRDRQRRNKEMAATLAENFDRDPLASPRKGYMELGDGPSTPGSTRGGSNLSRQGSQDAYFAGHKEGQQDFYNPHYVQERYGAANAGNYGMYEETELSVIGGNTGRSPSPYMQHGDHSAGYPPSSMAPGHYNAGYNQDRGYYGGGH
ncbi:hypothetical protein BGZ76_004621, partial [Entomortierella beljakovae]